MAKSETLQPLNSFTLESRSRVQFLLCDIDDTVSTDGVLPAASYTAIERLDAAGITVIPITGRPAGWCDMIARFWPVGGVVGENGALYFRYDRTAKRMIRHYWKSDAERAADRTRLDDLARDIPIAVPGSAIASDQAYREADLAIDFCEDVAPLPLSDIDRIVALFTERGAMAKVSSIHVNGWFGDYDKMAMTRILFDQEFAINLDEAKQHCAFVGDSPNDEPMFGFFENSVGVANLLNFRARLHTPPSYVTNERAGHGFVELADSLISARA